MLWIDKEHRDDDKDYHPLEDRSLSKVCWASTNASNVPQNKWLKWMYEGKVSDHGNGETNVLGSNVSDIRSSRQPCVHWGGPLEP